MRNVFVSSIKNTLKRFWRADEGATSIEFVIIFPVFFGFFLMTFESGMVSARHVMLERGVDVAVREVRVGILLDPTIEELRDRICEVSLIIPDCSAQLNLEMILQNPRSWTALGGTVPCVNRGSPSSTVVNYTNGLNNDLMLLRACVRIDPFLPTSGLGKAIVQNNSGAAAGGSYALVSLSAFVVEPFKAASGGGSGT